MVWKKSLCCVIMLLVLAGCGKGEAPKQAALDLRTALLEAGGCTFTAEITADLGNRVYDFSVSCDYDAGNRVKVQVVEPKEIAGINAVVSGNGAAVEFEDMALDFGTMAGGNVSAMEAPWLLAECWSGAYISAAGADGELYRITYLHGYDEKELVVDTWLDSAGNPIRSEVAYDGGRCLSLVLTQFQLKG